MTSEAEVCRMNMNRMPLPAPAAATKSATSRVISTNPSPRVSTVSVAATISSGAVAVMAERLLMAVCSGALRRAGRSTLFLHVALDVHHHLDETSPEFFHDGHDALDL